ncbi:nitrile hydratase [Streptomyces sp. NPDC049949]|uniref:nitrile hydratase n=1 Tax=Streptomyces sp. NPDC049949 TaxID=3154627 RepID=UPI00341DFDDA
MTNASDQNAGPIGPGTVDLEQALTTLAWSDPAVADNPGAALAQLGVDVPVGLRFDVRVQRPDTLYLVIPPVFPGEVGGESVVNQMDLWRSGDQFVWILPQDAKTALLEMREQHRNRGGEDGR